MIPAFLSILLDIHIFGRIISYEGESETRRQVLKDLFEFEFIEKTNHGFGITGKGMVFVGKLCNTPIE